MLLSDLDTLTAWDMCSLAHLGPHIGQTLPHQTVTGVRRPAQSVQHLMTWALLSAGTASPEHSRQTLVPHLLKTVRRQQLDSQMQWMCGLIDPKYYVSEG